MSQKPSQNAKSIGARFRSARSLVNLNRKAFCERYEINRYTMQSWENGLHVSKGKNVEKFIEALAKEGVACSAEWLFEGSGEPARTFGDSQIINSLEIEDDFSKKLIAFYKESSQKLISLMVQDSAMSPWFNEGDEVFGIDISNNPSKAHQKWCIVKLAEKLQVVRKVIVFKDQLIFTAEDKSIPSFNLAFGASLHLVIWHRFRQ